MFFYQNDVFIYFITLLFEPRTLEPYLNNAAVNAFSLPKYVENLDS